MIIKLMGNGLSVKGHNQRISTSLCQRNQAIGMTEVEIPQTALNIIMVLIRDQTHRKVKSISLRKTLVQGITDQEWVIVRIIHK